MDTKKIFDKKNVILLKELIKTDFKLRYKGSVLGILWSVLKPLMLFAVLYVIFVRFLKFTDGTPTFPIVLLLGISLWNFFTETTSVGMQSIVARGDLLRKVSFPKFIVVLSASIGALIGLAINLLVVSVFALATGVKFTWSALITPINIAQLYILAIGFAMLLASLYVKYRDISHIWEVMLQVLFYAMPIIYPLTLVSASYPMVAQIMMLNPIAQSIQDIRHNLIAPETTPTVWTTADNWFITIIPVILTIIIFVIGASYFHKNSKKFAEVI